MNIILDANLVAVIGGIAGALTGFWALYRSLKLFPAEIKKIEGEAEKNKSDAKLNNVKLIDQLENSMRDNYTEILSLRQEIQSLKIEIIDLRDYVKVLCEQITVQYQGTPIPPGTSHAKLDMNRD